MASRGSPRSDAVTVTETQGSRPVTAAGAADALERRLAVGLAARATNHDFEQIGAYLHAINRPDLAAVCLQRYLAVYRRYENEKNRTRGDVAFSLILKLVLDLATAAQLNAWHDA